MALTSFVIYRDRFGARLGTNTVEFWFMMQIAMVCGFITSYSMNWWLVRRGLKEQMY